MIGHIPCRVVLTYGVFDGLGPRGTARLRHLSGMGRELIVGCATDALCGRSGICCAIPYAQRRLLLERCRFVSRVIAQDCWDQVRTDIVNYNVSALALDDVPGTVSQQGLSDIVQVLEMPPRNASIPVANARLAS